MSRCLPFISKAVQTLLVSSLRWLHIAVDFLFFKKKKKKKEKPLLPCSHVVLNSINTCLVLASSLTDILLLKVHNTLLALITCLWTPRALPSHILRRCQK